MMLGTFQQAAIQRVEKIFERRMQLESLVETMSAYCRHQNVLLLDAIWISSRVLESKSSLESKRTRAVSDLLLFVIWRIVKSLVMQIKVQFGGYIFGL